jgi:hypothetical protein
VRQTGLWASARKPHRMLVSPFTDLLGRPWAFFVTQWEWDCTSNKPGVLGGTTIVLIYHHCLLVLLLDKNKSIIATWRKWNKWKNRLGFRSTWRMYSTNIGLLCLLLLYFCWLSLRTERSPRIIVLSCIVKQQDRLTPVDQVGFDAERVRCCERI